MMMIDDFRELRRDVRPFALRACIVVAVLLAIGVVIGHFLL
jgi:hypothetical protein